VLKKIVLANEVPFRIGRDLIVDIPVDPRETVDLYIEDFVSLMEDIHNNAVHLEQAPLLVVGSAAWEVSKVEPLPRNDMEAQLKLTAETGLTKQKTILEWLLDFRLMTITLPDNKFHAYSKAISKMMDQGWTSKGELEMNIGQWVHLGQIVPTVHHFLSRLHFLKQQSENRWQITIHEQCHDNLKFLLVVLGKCHQGIDLNPIAFGQPNHVYRSDSCPQR
jgi:hypothetical protein